MVYTKNSIIYQNTESSEPPHYDELYHILMNKFDLKYTMRNRNINVLSKKSIANL